MFHAEYPFQHHSNQCQLDDRPHARDGQCPFHAQAQRQGDQPVDDNQQGGQPNL